VWLLLQACRDFLESSGLAPVTQVLEHVVSLCPPPEDCVSPFASGPARCPGCPGCPAAIPDGPCASAPCQNGATCIDDGVGIDAGYFCQCPVDAFGTRTYYGSECETTEDDCATEHDHCAASEGTTCIDCSRFMFGHGTLDRPLPNPTCPDGYRCENRSDSGRSTWYVCQDSSVCAADSYAQIFAQAAGAEAGPCLAWPLGVMDGVTASLQPSLQSQVPGGFQWALMLDSTRQTLARSALDQLCPASCNTSIFYSENCG
jgi:hypothetical protein